MGDSLSRAPYLSIFGSQAAGHGLGPGTIPFAVSAALFLGLALAGAAAAADPIILSGGSAADHPSFSADGKRVALYYIGDGIIRVWDIAGRKALLELRGSWLPALSPDGKRLAGQPNKGFVSVWDTDTGRELLSLAVEAPLGALAFSPDSKTIADGDREGRVRLWDVAKGQVIDRPGPNPAEPVVAILFSPDGKTLVYATRDGTIKVHDVPGRKALATLKGYKTQDQALAFSKDGKVLAYADRLGVGGDRARVRFWDVAADKEAGEMLLGSGGIHFLYQLDDGKSWLVRMDYRLNLEVVVPGTTLLQLRRAPRLFRADEADGRLWCVAVSPDRKQLLLSVPNQVRIIDMPAFPPKDPKEKGKRADK
jgi:WD40 repeat protein